MKKIIIILPCYFEEEVLDITFEQLDLFFKELAKEKIITNDSRICFIDDGSRDKTWDIIDVLSKSNEHVIGIKLSRNFGHQFALLAGLETTFNQYDSYITIDADLQDDITVIKQMILKQEEGMSIIYGVRAGRGSDSFFKKHTAQIFYRMMAKLGVNTVYNHADFRLINNKVLENFLHFRESHLFLRGIFPLVGFKSGIVEYDRKNREAGETKYPLKKMLAFAWEGITSFSIKPLKIVTSLGFLTLLVSLILSAWTIYTKLLGKDVQGWSSTILVILFFSSVQMISIGILGEYIGKIYQQTKNRPRYIIEKILLK